jgi:hypothetical protein
VVTFSTCTLNLRVLAMPSQVADEASDILLRLVTRIGRLRFTARVQELLGARTEATKLHAEADRLQRLHNFLCTTAMVGE